MVAESNDSFQSLHGQAGVANARIAYEIYENILTSDRWQALAKRGANPQRLLWASTGVKDKGQRDTRYVTDLVAPNTVNTMPQATLHAVADHGEINEDSIRQNYIAAHNTIAALADAGVCLEDVATTLERQGVGSFKKSWNDLIESVTREIEKAGGNVMPAGAVKPAAKGHSPAAGAPE